MPGTLSLSICRRLNDLDLSFQLLANRHEIHLLTKGGYTGGLGTEVENSARDRARQRGGPHRLNWLQGYHPREGGDPFQSDLVGRWQLVLRDIIGR